MIALDTNVVVRIVTRDDPTQLEAALAAVQGNQLWLAKTVLLELEWVLRYTYQLSRETIEATFRKLLGWPDLQIEDHRSLIRSLSWYAQGMDFADALHLASSASAERLVTFDRRFARCAKDERDPRVELLVP